MNTKETAAKLFSQGFNCSQSVFAAFSEKYGLPSDIALKIGCGLGGGLRSGEVCGAVSGAVMVIGLRYGHSDSADTESKRLCYIKTAEFLQEFKKLNNSIICRELLGCDISNPDGMNTAQEKGLFGTTCVKMVCDAVDLLERLGY